ncbi:MAG: NAD-binding protein [Deltaproteobacteria bacterium]|nr:NAD-binding protein [Deltaproteobacteria bacterium]
MQQRAFIGTGLIGAGLAQAAAGRGDAVTVYNRTRAKAEALTQFGAVVADSLDAVAQQHTRIHLALTSDAAVDEVLDTLAPHLSPDGIVLDHSTTSIEGTRRRAERWTRRGLHYLHAPVFMSPQACREAKGMMLVSGPEQLVAQVRHELAQMTGALRELGPRPEAAAAFKLGGNALILTVLGGLADVFAMAGAHGFSPQQCSEVFAAFDLRPALAGRGARMAEGDYSTQWSLEMARKDVGLMLDAAGSVPLTMVSALAERMDVLLGQGHGERDVAVLSRDAISGE